jgi:PRC-barrel domain
MIHVAKLSIPALALTFAVAIGSVAETHAADPANPGAPGLVLAQAMVPPTGMMDAAKPTPMEQRYLRRFPQPARVGDLIGLPVLDLQASTIGYVQQVVRTQQGKIQFIVSYSRWWGWFGRPVAVPLEVLGIQGRELVSLDMPPRDYAKAPTWESHDVTALSPDTTIKVALARA